MEEVGAIRPRTKLQKCTESGRRLGYNSNILPLHAQHFCAFVNRLWTFPCHGGIAEDPSRSLNAWNLQWLSTFPAPRGSSEDHSMLCNTWNLQYIINIFLFSGGVRGPLHVDQTVKFATYLQIFLSSGKLRGPLDVMQRMEFAIYYQHFPILGRGLRTTRCWSNRGICNSLSTFPAPRRSSDDHSTSCNAWNLQYIINISLFSGEIRAPLDVDQTIDFTIDYQHFRVLGGGSEDHTMSCNAWNLQYIKSMFPDIICNIGNIINYKIIQNIMHSTHGIYNILWIFSYPQGSSEDHSMSCNAWNLQYIINVFLSSGEVRGPFDADQTAEFAIYYQHFPVMQRMKFTIYH